MFYVVQFDNKTVSVVPNTWYNEGVTMWPNYNSDVRINRAVRSAEPPNPNWTQHPVRLLKACDDYTSAWHCLKRSLTCETSELESSDKEDAHGRIKRKPKPIHHYGDTDDSEEESISTKRSKFHQSHSNQLQPVPSPISSRCNQRTSGQSSFPVAPTPPTPEMPAFPSQNHPSPPCLTELQPLESVSTFSSSEMASFCTAQSTPYRSPLPPSVETFNPVVRLGRSGRDPIPCTPAELHLLTLLENVKQQVSQLSAMVNTVLTRTNPVSEPSAEMPEEISFPLTSVDEVEQFEVWIQDAANLTKKKQMISWLASIGGQTTKQLTWNILAHVFSHNVAKNINWKGMNNKKQFSSMATKGLLTRAVRKNNLGQKATETEINHYFIRWFNLASDRGGGRKERAERSQV